MSPQPRLLTLLLAAIALPGCRAEEGTACLYVSEETTECPAADDLDKDDLFIPWTCDDMAIRRIVGEGELDTIGSETGGSGDPACCYPAKVVDRSPLSDCVIGRPWHDATGARTAPLARRGDWGGAEGRGGEAGDPSPDGARAAAWASAAAGEHASVAAFARLSLELMAHGAPAELVRAVHEAALDEIDHAERCYALASRFGGAPVGPGPLPSTGPLASARSLADLAAEAVRDGCVIETLGAHLGREVAERCEDPSVRDDLLAIAADEERHAALSWRLVAWALQVGGAEVREAVSSALRAPAPKLGLEALALRADLDPAQLQPEIQAVLVSVIRPAARQLLAT